MNKVVREHYPVEKLPADLRAELGLARTVTVTIEAEERPAEVASSATEAIAALHRIRAAVRETQSDSVERVSKLRDEWDR